MATKDEIKAAIQAAADATGDGNLRISLGAPGSHVENSIGEMQPTGGAWVPEPKTWPVVIEGLANWLDGGGGAQIPTHRQAAEPVLGADDHHCFWVDTTTNQAWLVFRRGVGDQVKVELS